MKRCPKCKREFEDTLRFCLEDGIPLVEDSRTLGVSPVTEVMSAPPGTSPTPAISDSLKPVAHARGLPPRQRDESGSGISRVTAVIVAVAMSLGLILAFLGATFWGTFYTRRIPMILLCLAGMLVAILRSGRRPTAHLLLGLGLGLFLLRSYVFTGLAYNLPDLAEQFHFRLRSLALTVSLIDNLFYAITIIMIVCAVFIGRQHPNKGQYQT